MSDHGFHVKMLADSQAEILIYEEVGDGFFGGVSAKLFAEELKAIGKVDTINLHINSPGGDVYQGLAIYNTLKQHGAKVVVDVDGIAASIASVIAMAGEKIRMRQGTMMMVHDPWSIMAGGAEDFRKTADVLDKIKENIVDVYKARTGMDLRNIRRMMTEETWMSAEEAVSHGFATEVVKDAKAIAAKLDKTIFRNAPQEWLEQQEQAESIEKRVDPWRLRLRQRWQEFQENMN